MTQDALSNNVIQVMVVDDSSAIRGFITEALEKEGNIQVVASAANGQIAVNLLKRQTPEKLDIDVIVLDVEMPEKDGLTALPEILDLAPDVKIIMASTMAEEEVKKSMQALEWGAAEYLIKNTEEEERRVSLEFKRDLVEKVKALAATDTSASQLSEEVEVSTAVNVVQETEVPVTPESGQVLIPLRKPPPAFFPEVLAIASSTGGPRALEEFFRQLKGKKFLLPVFITQHMPEGFTTIFAKQLASAAGIPCKEGEDGEKVQAGTIYVAPGDYHMVVEKNNGEVCIRLNQDPPENFCRPAADPMIRSIVDVYGAERVLLSVFTGMGADGCQAAEAVAQGGGVIIAQDKETSVVWGMPGAVAQKGLCAMVLPLERMADSVMSFSGGKIYGG